MSGLGGQPGALVGNLYIQLPEGASVAQAMQEVVFRLNVAKQQGWLGVVPGM